MQKFKKLFYSVLTCSFLFNINLPSYSTEREVRVYSGRHYNTDRNVYKKFAEETGIKVRLIEAAGISLIERLKRINCPEEIISEIIGLKKRTIFYKNEVSVEMKYSWLNQIIEW